MSRFSSDDPIEEARRRHAQDEARQYSEDQRETERQWRDFERRRVDQLRSQPGRWEIRQVSESSWKVYLNDRAVALVVDTGTTKGTAIFEFVDRGEAIIKYLQPGVVTPQTILQAFEQRALTEGA